MANGRHIMFACRLSVEEHDALTRLLRLSYCNPQDISGQFRSLVLELDHKLDRDLAHNLIIKGLSKTSNRDDEKRTKQARSLFDMVNSLR